LSFLLIIIQVLWFQGQLVIRRFIKCLKTLFLKSYGNHVHLPRIAESHFEGFKNSVDSRFPWVTKSSIDKLLNKLVKKSSRIDFSNLCVL
jgi:hypothetical protein